MIRGTVGKVFTREWQGDDGVVLLHSFQLNGDKRYFRTGTERLVNEGDYVTFDVEGNNNVVPHSVEKGQAQVAQAPSPPSGGFNGRSNWGGNRGASGGGGGKPKSDYAERQAYWDDKAKRDIEVVEPRITFSAAQRDAIDIVKVALQHDMLSFGNASKGAKLGMLLDYVDEVAARFYSQRFNAAETVAGLTPVDTSVKTKGGKAAAKDEADDE